MGEQPLTSRQLAILRALASGDATKAADIGDVIYIHDGSDPGSAWRHLDRLRKRGLVAHDHVWFLTRHGMETVLRAAAQEPGQ